MERWMALKITLKPGESVYVGRAEIFGEGSSITHLFVAGDAAVLRQQDYIRHEFADTTAKKLQLTLQEMYLSGDAAAYHEKYFSLVQALIVEEPKANELIADINRLLIEGQFFKAIKLAKCISDPTLTFNVTRLRTANVS
jgi:flagellar biosynthesis regulator FlbT